MTEPESEKIGQNLAARFGASAVVGLCFVGLLQTVTPSLGADLAVTVLTLAAYLAVIGTALDETGVMPA